MQRYGESGGKKKRVSKLSLIDLAGSERQNKTDNRGVRLVEVSSHLRLKDLVRWLPSPP